MTAHEEYSPIALFAYSRVDHLRKTVDSLLANRECGETRLFVYCDGPRHDRHKAQTDMVRAFVDKIEGFAAVTRVYRSQNLGLARSIIDGVSEVVAKYGTVIVMEDDLVVSPYFLRYMNDGLRRYEADERIASIHGYCYPVLEKLPETFFLRGADCWGWATWARAWRHFEPDGQKLLDGLRRAGLTRAFDLDGAYPYARMLKNQVAGRNDSWAVRWHASCFLKDMLTLYPGRSLVNNIGTDDSGTHCSATEDFAQVVAAAPVEVTQIEVQESQLARKTFARFLGRNTSPFSRMKRVMSRLLKMLGWP